MRRCAVILGSLALVATLLPMAASATPVPTKPTPQAGDACGTKGKVLTEASGQQLTCVKQGKRLVWKITKPLPTDVGTQPIPKDGVWFTMPGFPKDLPPPNWRGPEGAAKDQREASWFSYNWDVPTAVPVGPRCRAGNQPLAAYATDIDRLDSITPQGYVQPGSHATPVPHMYYQTGDPSPADAELGFVSERVPVYAVADMTLRGVAKSYSSGPLEWMVSFSVCGQIWVFHAHLGTLVPKIMNAIGSAPNREPMNCTGDACTMFYYLSIPFKAGDRIGTSSGLSGGFDFGLEDMSSPSPGRLDAKRWAPRWAASRCHIDYYKSAAMRETLTGLLSGPSCGQLASEKKGTAAGVWFFTGDCPPSPPGPCPSAREDYHLSLVRDTGTENGWVFSVGTQTSIPGLQGLVYSVTAASSGTNNRTFDKVGLGTIACYDALSVRGPSQPGAVPTIYLRVTAVDSDTEQIAIWADATGADCKATSKVPGTATLFQRNTNRP